MQPGFSSIVRVCVHVGHFLVRKIEKRRSGWSAHSCACAGMIWLSASARMCGPWLSWSVTLAVCVRQRRPYSCMFSLASLSNAHECGMAHFSWMCNYSNSNGSVLRRDVALWLLFVVCVFFSFACVMYISMYLYIYMYTYIYMCISISTHMYIYIDVRTNIST